jgi:hypothetical protein
METIFLVLSGVILAAGVLYWFWSHIQLTQKKVQLLENAVFELRGLVSGNPDAAVGGGGPSPTEKVPTPVYRDLADDEEEDWPSVPSGVPASVPVQRPSSVEIGSTPLSSLQEEASADLQPGGRLEVPSPSTDEPPSPKVVNTDDQFRELFVQREPRTPASPAAAATTSAASAASAGSSDDATATAAAPASVTSESLESMPVKDLRRLAEQRGLTGVSELRKKELLSALRQQITSVPAAGTEKSTTVVVERTLDLTQMEADGLQDATVLE